MSNSEPIRDDQHQRKTEFELEILKQEYFFLQATVEDYNKQIWVVKALGITGTGAVITLIIQQKQELITLIGCIIPVFFWILESQWKHFQHGFYPRISEIELIFREKYSLLSPVIFGEWNQAFKRNIPYKRRGYIWDGLLNPSVLISYVLEIAFLLLFYSISIANPKLL